MKKITTCILLFFTFYIQHSYAQVTISHVQVLEHDETVAATTTTNNQTHRLVRTVDENTTIGGYVITHDYEGNQVGDIIAVPNYYPDVNNGGPHTLTSSGDDVYLVASTWAQLTGAGLDITESLIKVPQTGAITAATIQVHGYNSTYSMLGADADYIYAVINRKNGGVVGGDVDGGGMNLLSNDVGTFFVKFDRNLNLLESVKMFDFAALNEFVNGKIARDNIITLDNGYLAMRLRDPDFNEKTYMVVVDPHNVDDGTGSLQPVHVFENNDLASNGKFSLRYCNGNYILGQQRSGRIRVYDENFQLTGENFSYTFDFGGNPSDFACLEGGDVMTLINLVDADFLGQMNRFAFSDAKGSQQSFVGFNSPDWKFYFKAHRIGDLEFLVTTNYRLYSPVVFGGVTIPAADFYDDHDIHSVSFRIKITRPTETLTINTDPPELLAIHHNKCFDPTDPTQLVDCQGQSVATIASNVTLPDDLQTPSFLLASLNVPDGFEAFAATMDTDPTMPAGFQRYYHAETIPSSTGYIYSLIGYSRRVYLTTQTYTIVDTDNDGVPDSQDNCPEIANSDQADTDGDGVGDVCDQEECDGLDNDGDGEIDEGVTQNFYQDADNDGFGDPAVSVQACSQPAGYVIDNTDQCPDVAGNINGCPDTDGDGIIDMNDQCPNTPSGETVNANGCAASQLDDDNDGVMNDVDQCTGNQSGDVVGADGCIQLSPDTFTFFGTTAPCPNQNKATIQVTNTSSYSFHYTIEGPNGYQQTQSSVAPASNYLLADNLAAGTYTISIQFTDAHRGKDIEGTTVVISEPSAVSGRHQGTNSVARTATYTVSGDTQYHIYVNEVYQRTVTFPDENEYEIVIDGLTVGEQYVEIIPENACRGEIEDWVAISDTLSYYPNPTRDVLQIKGLTANADIVIYSMQGTQVQRQTLVNVSQSVTVNVQALPSGVYIVHIYPQNEERVEFKMVKQ